MSRKFWMLVIMLLLLTAIYPVAVYLSIQKYEAWKQAQLEILPPQIARVADFAGYGGETYLLIFLLGPILAICWIVLFLIWGKRRNYFSGVS